VHGIRGFCEIIAASFSAMMRPSCLVLSGCENFLYVFKAAPRGRSRRRHGAQARKLYSEEVQQPCRASNDLIRPVKGT
jgi:hypothetical protein